MPGTTEKNPGRHGCSEARFSTGSNFVATFFFAWAKLSGQDLVEMVRRRTATTIALGFLSGAWSPCSC
jgi:hypothetical protein